MDQNVKSGLEGNFKKRSLAVIDHLGTSYDYGSVMHYGTHYFSRNGRATIVPKRSGVDIGQRQGFSNVDVQRINKLYKCSRGTTTKPRRRPKSRPTSAPRPKARTTPAPRPRPRPTAAPRPAKASSGACYQTVPMTGRTVRTRLGCYLDFKLAGTVP